MNANLDHLICEDCIQQSKLSKLAKRTGKCYFCAGLRRFFYDVAENLPDEKMAEILLLRLAKLFDAANKLPAAKTILKKLPTSELVALSLQSLPETVHTLVADELSNRTDEPAAKSSRD